MLLIGGGATGETLWCILCSEVIGGGAISWSEVIGGAISCAISCVACDSYVFSTGGGGGGGGGGGAV